MKNGWILIPSRWRELRSVSHILASTQALQEESDNFTADICHFILQEAYEQTVGTLTEKIIASTIMQEQLEIKAAISKPTLIPNYTFPGTETEPLLKWVSIAITDL